MTDPQAAEALGDESVAEPQAQRVPAATSGTAMIDPRGPRFAAAVTVVVLAFALLTIPSITAVLILVWQAIAFGAAALFGLKAHPYGAIYRVLVQPRLGPPKELEEEAPPRFAQQVGLGFVLIALVGLAFGVPLVATVAVACALAAAFLNAAFNFCLGCEIYLIGRRIAARRRTA